jgi:hypothetical protein
MSDIAETRSYRNDGKRGHAMRFCEDKAADLERARAAVAQWREQNPVGNQDQITAALGAQFHPDYGPVLRAVLFALDQRPHVAQRRGTSRLQNP